MYTNLIKAPKHRGRRRHAEEFKRQVIAACLQPGISIAAVALANGLNANLLRRWVKEQRDAQPAGKDGGRCDQSAEVRPPTLVPVTVSSPEIEPMGEIKIEIHRPQAVIEISWPVSQAAMCADWLRELLR